MSRSHYGHSTLSGLVDSDSEDATLRTLDAISTPESAAKNAIIFTKGQERRKPTSGKIMKARVTGRRVSGAMAVPGKKGKRTPLTDKTNQQQASDTEEVDEFEQQDVTIDTVASGDELDASVIAVKPRKSRPTKAKAGTRITKIGKTSSQSVNTAQADSPETRQTAPRAGKAQSQAKRQQSAEPKHRSQVIQETQISAMDVDDYGDDDDVEETTPRLTTRYTSVPHATSRQTSVPRRRAGSASDTERNDPALRRKLGEMTKKYENLDLRYRNVREIGIKEAEHNFERLKKQSEESKKAANVLIASLKADLAKQKIQAKESLDLKGLVDTQAARILSLEAKVAQLTLSLSDAHVENKTLSTKLALNRNVAASVESASSRAPGSAVKANGGIRIMGSVETAQAAQAAQLKENLYSDLTGLIIRDVKREAGDDVYDCIQTGRNGTLHFKLAVANEKNGDSYDDAHCVYIPQLDPSRDEALMDLLHDYDYLVEEITFPRPHSAKFYARVFKALTERISHQ